MIEGGPMLKKLSAEKPDQAALVLIAIWEGMATETAHTFAQVAREGDTSGCLGLLRHEQGLQLALWQKIHDLSVEAGLRRLQEETP